MFSGNILETHYMIDLPTSPEELATLLDNYAQDWGIVLNFLDAVATKRGIVLDVHKICEILKRRYAEHR